MRPSESGADAIGAAAREVGAGEAVAVFDVSGGASEFATDAAVFSDAAAVSEEDGSKDVDAEFEAEFDPSGDASADEDDADGGDSTPAEASNVAGS